MPAMSHFYDHFDTVDDGDDVLRDICRRGPIDRDGLLVCSMRLIPGRGYAGVSVWHREAYAFQRLPSASLLPQEVRVENAFAVPEYRSQRGMYARRGQVPR